MNLHVFYISNSVWVLRIPNAGQNMQFQCSIAKKLEKSKKVRNLHQNLTKNCFFKFYQNAGRRFNPQKKLVFTYPPASEASREVY